MRGSRGLRDRCAREPYTYSATLLLLLEDEDRRVRESAAIALGTLGVNSPEVRQGLERASRDPGGGVRECAREALGRLDRYWRDYHFRHKHSGPALPR